MGKAYYYSTGVYFPKSRELRSDPTKLFSDAYGIVRRAETEKFSRVTLYVEKKEKRRNDSVTVAISLSEIQKLRESLTSRGADLVADLEELVIEVFKEKEKEKRD